MRTTRGRSRRAAPHGDHGAAAVEFALVLPLLLLILFGIIDFGRWYNAQITLTQAAREGVRYAAIGITSPSPATRTTNAALPLTGVTVAVTACPASPGATSNATVTASKPFTIADPGYAALRAMANRVGGSFPSSITVTGTGTMRCTG